MENISSISVFKILLDVLLVILIIVFFFKIIVSDLGKDAIKYLKNPKFYNNPNYKMFFIITNNKTQSYLVYHYSAGNASDFIQNKYKEDIELVCEVKDNKYIINGSKYDLEELHQKFKFDNYPSFLILKKNDKEIDDIIEEWHNNPNITQPLKEYLGVSEKVYEDNILKRKWW